MKQKIFLFVSVLLMSIPGPTASALDAPSQYAAVGDSVAAGDGLAGPDTTPDGVLCGRTADAYPHRLADKLGSPVTNFACNGATIDEGLLGAQDRFGAEVAPQVRAMFDGGHPDLITVSVGANDVQWIQAIVGCSKAKCGTFTDTLRFELYRADFALKLRLLMTYIDARSDGVPPTVLLNGYYHAITAKALCADTPGITDDEVDWLNHRTDDLNDTIRGVADSYPYAHFVAQDFSGHEVCTADSWVQGLSDPAGYHPNARGQEAMAEADRHLYLRL